MEIIIVLISFVVLGTLAVVVLWLLFHEMFYLIGAINKEHKMAKQNKIRMVADELIVKGKDK
jgi:hypothetical protein